MKSKKQIDWSGRIGFYPCSGNDVDTPLELLSNDTDTFIFSDIRPIRKPRQPHADTEVVRLIGDVRNTIHQIEKIDYVFYRRDSNGEGGSGIYVLGDSFMPRILERFNPEGGMIITDGSNSRGSTFERMQRPGGLHRHGKWMRLAPIQNFKNLGLLTFLVSESTG